MSWLRAILVAIFLFLAILCGCLLQFQLVGLNLIIVVLIFIYNKLDNILEELENKNDKNE